MVATAVLADIALIAVITVIALHGGGAVITCLFLVCCVDGLLLISRSIIKQEL